MRSFLTGYSPRDLTSFFGEKIEAELSISLDAVARKTLTQYKKKQTNKQKERRKERERKKPTGNHDLAAN